MSFLFVSSLPKEESIESIQAFLEASFPSSISIRILRSGQGHKGHAYVHFADERAAQVASEPYTVAHSDGSGKEVLTPLMYSDNRTELRLRVCDAGGRSKIGDLTDATRFHEPSATPNALIAAIEGMPLPPHCADMAPYKRCRYVVSSDGTKCSAEDENKRPFLAMRQIGTVEDDLTSTKVCVIVAPDTEEKEVGEGTQRDVSIVRCGPPSLKALFEPACGLREQLRLREGWDVEKDQPRKWSPEVDGEEAETIVDRDEGYVQGSDQGHQQNQELESRLKCMQGCSWLSPSETLDALRLFFDGKGGVAVKDKFGSVAVMSLPAYVASLE